ncbi:hypothetical protein FQD73_023095 (plasmid) [Salmonella enterica subsp. enterica serovar Schwarzengrund]|nr:hypothetical protein FQD73_023095 [Salmonella enterica subsp. enterica serovar Schwarzengrund]
MTMRRMRGIYSWTPSPLLTVMCSVGDLLPRSGGGMACQPPEKPWQAYACLKMQEGRACGAALPARHGVRHFFCYVVSVVLISEAGTPSAPGCLAASGRQARLRQAACWRTRQSPPNPLARFRAAATVRCLKKPGLQRPFRSRRPCRAGNGAPCTPDGV